VLASRCGHASVIVTKKGFVVLGAEASIPASDWFVASDLSAAEQSLAWVSSRSAKHPFFPKITPQT